jgi:hypothetical protein
MAAVNVMASGTMTLLKQAVAFLKKSSAKDFFIWR